MSGTGHYTDLATRLIQSSRRSTQTDTLHAYDSTSVRSIARETRQLQTLIQHTVETTGLSQLSLTQDSATIALLTVQHLCARRNKRCLLAYHQHRLDMLRDMYWDAGAALAHLLNEHAGGGVRERLSPHEVDFLRAYAELVADYKEPFLDVLDITGGEMEPPKELHISVRVVRDAGVIETEGGPVDFRKGQRFMVRRNDVERLIVQGYLEEVR